MTPSSGKRRHGRTDTARAVLACSMVCAAALVRGAASGEVPGQSIAASCRTGNPYVAVTRYFGPQSSLPPRPAIFAVHDTSIEGVSEQLAAQFQLATEAQVKAVYGLAYDAAAYFRSHAAFGPGGPGGIYRIDLDSGAVELWAKLEAGPDYHREGDDGPGEWPWVGKVSLADIEIDDSGDVLFVVNLYDRRIHRLTIPDGVELPPIEHGAWHEAWAANARTYGLGVQDGWLYHGVVDTREDAGLPGSLVAYVYRSRTDGSQLSEVARLRLDYRSAMPWRPWVDVDDWPRNSEAIRYQPLVRDIEFAPDGGPIIGLGDRTFDMQLNWSEGGDVLATRRTSPGTWAVITAPEFYRDDVFCVWHQECSHGSLATTSGAHLVSTMNQNGGGGGLGWFDTRTGEVQGANDGWEWVYADGWGEGDIETLCQPNPVLYVPVVARGSCPYRRHVDAALVLDMSTTMLHLARDGRPKHEAAVAAARGFVRLLRLAASGAPDGDQAAVVGFNDEAWIEQGLTSGAELLDGALGRLPGRIAEGTRLDLALARALEVLIRRPRGDDNLPLTILLTDGLPNRVPPAEDARQETTVLRAADALKATGAQVYTIGLGLPGDLNEDLLRQMASSPSMYYYAPDAAQLDDIYARLAEVVGCP
jgi:Mg-chelatase subunit ChlD